MTKLNEQVHWDGRKMIVQEQHDFHSVAEQAKTLKSAGLESVGESKLVARIPVKLLAEWAKEAGVKFSDTGAMRELLARKLMDADNSQFRVWEGRF